MSELTDEGDSYLTEGRSSTSASPSGPRRPVDAVDRGRSHRRIDGVQEPESANQCSYDERFRPVKMRAPDRRELLRPQAPTTLQSLQIPVYRLKEVIRAEK